MQNMQNMQNQANLTDQTNASVLDFQQGRAAGPTVVLEVIADLNCQRRRPKVAKDERKKATKKLMLQETQITNCAARQTRNTFHQNFTYITIYTSMFPHKSVSAKQVVQLQGTQKQ